MTPILSRNLCEARLETSLVQSQTLLSTGWGQRERKRLRDRKGWASGGGDRQKQILTQRERRAYVCFICKISEPNTYVIKKYVCIINRYESLSSFKKGNVDCLGYFARSRDSKRTKWPMSSLKLSVLVSSNISETLTLMWQL